LRQVGKTILESSPAAKKQDNIAQLERACFESIEFDIDIETATVEEKYEALLIAFSTGYVENEDGDWDAQEE